MTKQDNENDGWATVPASKPKGRRQQRHHLKWSAAPLMVEYIEPTPVNSNFEPFLLMLVGLPGSGKSTFAKALEYAMPYKVCLQIICCFMCFKLK